MVFRDADLYRECLESSRHRKLIQTSHLPFQDGYYITEYGVILMVRESLIYRLEDDGWNPNQRYFELWYDGTDRFADIPSAVAERLGLGEYRIKPRG